MPSANKDKFNHDSQAVGYDLEVRDESNPIRAGYQRTLDWVAAQVPARSCVIDLGCGTGNLACRISEPAKLYCVDISANMIALARDKLRAVDCEFIQADLLDAFHSLPSVDAVVSTYAIHHLTSAEKAALFAVVHKQLHPGGKAVFGDLMFESHEAEERLCAEYARAGREPLVREIKSEFFWHIDEALEQLRHLGFRCSHERFAELSWGLAAEKPSA